MTRPRDFAAIGMAVLAFGAVCRRHASAPPAGPSVGRPVESDDVAARSPAPRGSPRVIWIALDGLDPDWMDRLSGEGAVPNWSRLAAGGRVDRLASFEPILSPIVWTTEATGFGPDIHRVLDFQEVEPATGRKVPISGLSRAVPAIWNLASAAGKTVGVAGWWATHPAEVVRGFMISDRAFPLLFDAPASGAAYPPVLDEKVRTVVARDGKIAVADLRPYLRLSDDEIGRGLASAEGMAEPVFALGRILSSTRVGQRLARELYDRERPELMTVYFEGTDEIGHVFAAEASPPRSCVPAEKAAAFGQTAAAYYRTIDAILGQWMRRAREDGATLLVTSDHGFRWGDDRPCARSSNESSTAASWHRKDGVLAVWGSRVAPGRDLEHPTVFDVTPTVLALLELPADVRMKGRPLSAAFPALPPRPATRQIEAISVDRVAAAPPSASAAGEDAKKLVALGYLSARDVADLPSARGGERGRPGMTEGAWNNLGVYERETAGDLVEAEKAFRKALALRADYHSPIFNLALIDRARHRDAAARDGLFRALAAGHPDPSGAILAWASEYRSARDPAAETALLRRARETYPADERLARALADALFRRQDCAGARSAIEAFSDSTRQSETLNAMGLYETCLGHPDAARVLFQRSLAIKPGQPGAIEALRVLGK
jgi:predicted AlkP superfamily phosphohydrolase/phosphomutase/Flp pilus assembly protein TadD